VLGRGTRRGETDCDGTESKARVGIYGICNKRSVGSQSGDGAGHPGRGGVVKCGEVKPLIGGWN
jgi:hypothetical protein